MRLLLLVTAMMLAVTARPLDAAGTPNKPAEVAPGSYSPSYHYSASDIQQAFKLQLNTPFVCKW